MPAPAKPRPTTEDRIRAALWFAERGFGVFSVWSTEPDGTCRCPTGTACDQPGKHPIPAIGFKAATTDEFRIRAMLTTLTEPNWGMLPPEGVFALDVDGEGVARLVELEAAHGALPPTLRTNTAHGQHVFLRWPDGHPRPIGQLFGYVTRWGSGANAGYVIGPRSVHASGAVYVPAGPDLEIATLPEAWAVAAVAAAPRPDDEITVTGGYELPHEGYTGSRYDAIRDYVASRYMRGVTKAEVLAGVLGVLAPRFAQPLAEPDLRSRFERAWKGTPERLGAPVASESPTTSSGAVRAAGTGMDAAALLALDLPPLRWVVPDLIPEGTTILAAPPKVGKSCLVYQVAVESAIGGDLLGRRVTPGSVLYLALEDGRRRGQDRLRKVLAGRTMPQGRLEIRWDSSRIGQGLEDDIATWLDAHADASVVALDTLGKVRPRSSGKQGAYEVDVQDLARLQDLFRDRPVALVIVHHARKETHDDFLASVSGTYGITGSADTIVAIRRKRLERFGTVLTTGRDIADAEIPVQFNDGLWTEAPGALPEASFERTEIYRVIEEMGPVFPKAIADQLGMERTNVQHRVTALVDAGAVARTKGGYVIAGVRLELPIRPNTPSNSSHSPSDHSDWGEVTRAPAREADGVSVSCRAYREHQLTHYRDSAGEWRCPTCNPEGAA